MATTNFPTALDAGGLVNPGPGDNTAAPSHSDVHSIVNDAIKALEAKLGIGAATPTSTNILRGNGAGTSTWGKLVLSTDVTGTLGVANGGTGTTTATGTGMLVLDTAPTIVTPTIASFINANHTHANAAGGGTLNGANVIQSETITAAQIVNRTRWALFNKTVDAAAAGVTISQQEAGEVQFTSTPAGYGRLDLLVPQDYVSGTTATINLVMYSSNANNQVMNYYVGCRASGSTFASWNLVSNSNTASTINLTTNVVSTFVLYTIAAVNLAAGNIITVATKPASAVTGSIWLTEAYLSYTSDM